MITPSLRKNIYIFPVPFFSEKGVIRKFTIDEYSDIYTSTIGVDFKIKSIDIKGKRIKLQIWDVSGQERFHTIVSSYYRNIDGIIICYDITDSRTFNNINKWKIDIDKYASIDVCLLLCGTKLDLNKDRVVDEIAGKTISYELNADFAEISNKDDDDENINIMFNNFVEKIITSPRILLKNNNDLYFNIDLGIDQNIDDNNKTKKNKCCYLL